MTKYRWQLVITFLSWYVWEFICVAQTRAIQADHAAQASLFSLVLPLIALISGSWIIDQKTWGGRLGLTACGAVGSALGTWCILTVFGGHL